MWSCGPSPATSWHSPVVARRTIEASASLHFSLQWQFISVVGNGPLQSLFSHHSYQYSSFRFTVFLLAPDSFTPASCFQRMQFQYVTTCCTSHWALVTSPSTSRRKHTRITDHPFQRSHRALSTYESRQFIVAWRRTLRQWRWQQQRLVVGRRRSHGRRGRRLVPHSDLSSAARVTVPRRRAVPDTSLQQQHREAHEEQQKADEEEQQHQEDDAGELVLLVGDVVADVHLGEG